MQVTGVESSIPASLVQAALERIDRRIATLEASLTQQFALTAATVEGLTPILHSLEAAPQVLKSLADAGRHARLEQRTEPTIGEQAPEATGWATGVGPTRSDGKFVLPRASSSRSQLRCRSWDTESASHRPQAERGKRHVTLGLEHCRPSDHTESQLGRASTQRNTASHPSSTGSLRRRPGGRHGQPLIGERPCKPKAKRRSERSDSLSKSGSLNPHRRPSDASVVSPPATSRMPTAETVVSCSDKACGSPVRRTVSTILSTGRPVSPGALATTRAVSATSPASLARTLEQLNVPNNSSSFQLQTPGFVATLESDEVPEARLGSGRHGRPTLQSLSDEESSSHSDAPEGADAVAVYASAPAQRDQRLSWRRGGSSADGSLLSLVPQSHPDAMELACMAKQACLSRVWLNPAADLETGCFVLAPAAPTRLIWDVLVACATIWTGFIIPAGIAYLGGASFLCGGPVGVLLLLVDGVLFADIALNFRTGVMKQGRLVLDPWHIALIYARGWFALDFLCAVPLLAVSSEGFLFGALCALKLLRVIRLVPLCGKLQKEYGGVIVPTAMKIGGLVLWCAHLLACGWRMALHSESGMGHQDLGAQRWGDAYVEDLYWVWMTMSTVGYGDIVPSTTTSRVFAILAMVTAPIFFGAVVSGLTHVTRGLLDDETERRVSQAARYMRRRGLSQGLVRRVQHNLRHRLHRHPGMRMDPELFGLLSPAVQKELSLSLLSGTVLQFPLFRGARHSFVAALAQKHTWVECFVGDLVVEDGQLMEEIVFVIQGRLCVQLGRGSRFPVLDLGVDGSDLEMTTPLGEDLSFEPSGRREVEIESGAWFGEMCLFDQKRTRTSTVIAVQDSDLAVLKATEYLKVVQMYPRLWERHHFIARGLTDGTVKAEELAYRSGMDPMRRGLSRNSLPMLR